MANSEDIPSDAPPSFSAETYFATQPPPPTLEEDVSRVLDFIQRQREAKRKVVLVTVRIVLLIVFGALVTHSSRVVVQRYRWSSMCENAPSFMLEELGIGSSMCVFQRAISRQF